jgi:hypothetical protein
MASSVGDQARLPAAAPCRKSGTLNLLYGSNRHGYEATMRHVICLSTIPPRFAAIGPTLQALVRQKSRPEAVELYIPRSYRRFPQWGGALPEVPEGVRIVRIDEDLGPATKILPALRAYRGEDIELLYVDDDIYFAPDWSKRVLKLRRKLPNTALCATSLTVAMLGRPWRATAPLPRAVPAAGADQQFAFHFRRLLSAIRRKDPAAPRLRTWYRKIKRSGYTDIVEGFAGVSLRPDYLDDAVFDLPPVLWAVDDIWISGHLTRRGVPIWADRSLECSQVFAGLYEHHALFKSVIDGADREQANLACVDYMRETYGIWGGTKAA